MSDRRLGQAINAAKKEITGAIQELRDNDLHEIGTRLVHLEAQHKRIDRRLARIEDQLEVIVMRLPVNTAQPVR